MKKIKTKRNKQTTKEIRRTVVLILFSLFIYYFNYHSFIVVSPPFSHKVDPPRANH
jgi:hypothetical protein